MQNRMGAVKIRRRDCSAGTVWKKIRRRILKDPLPRLPITRRDDIDKEHRKEENLIFKIGAPSWKWKIIVSC